MASIGVRSSCGVSRSHSRGDMSTQELPPTATPPDRGVESGPHLGGNLRKSAVSQRRKRGRGTVRKARWWRVAVRLCGPSGPVVLLREGRLAKLREELVEPIKRNRLRRGDLDAHGTGCQA
jgi:hypothetical protein